MPKTTHNEPSYVPFLFCLDGCYDFQNHTDCAVPNPIPVSSSLDDDNDNDNRNDDDNDADDDDCHYSSFCIPEYSI